ncbi:MAG: Trk system potassium transporter TrkA [Clostridiales bacterium]|nr:Trk system potassium transporter TrkA [Candidatus Crickella caballi]
MRIVIAGAGRVGGTVAEALTEEGHDLTIIDRDSELISHISNDVDAICIEGSATDVDILKDADSGNADMFLAITEADETNLVSSVLAKNMGANYIIARLRNPEYLGKESYVKQALGISLLINPELLCAREILRIIQFRGASHATTFTGGNTELLKYKVSVKDKLCGTSVRDTRSITSANILVCYIINEDGVFIPSADYVYRENDVLAITGNFHNLKKFFNSVVPRSGKIRNAIIYGGGRVTVYLARLLMQTGIEVTIIEEDRARCERLCELVPHAHIVCGDGTKRDVMIEEGIMETDAYIALTNDDGNNIITSIYAKHCDVGMVVSKTEHVHFADLMEISIIDKIITPKILAARQIVGYVRAINNSLSQEIESIYYLEDGQLDALEFKIKNDSAVIGVPLMELKIRNDIKIAAIIRNSTTMMPTGESIIEKGDAVVIIAKANEIKRIEDILV